VSKRLIDFLIDVSVNVKARDEFRRDPESVLAKTGLSKAEKDAVLSGDPERIRVAAAISAASGNVGIGIRQFQGTPMRSSGFDS